MKSRSQKNVVIILLAVTALLISFLIFARYSAKENFLLVETIASMERTQLLLESYRKACGKYPTTAEGLSKLFEHSKSKCSTYLPPDKGSAHLELDAWKNPISYSSDGISYRILSAGSSWIEAKPLQKVAPIEQSE